MANQIISGIYKIENTVNGKCYIGSTINFKIRIRDHKTGLRNGCHHSIKLQRAWNKYGRESFLFYLVESVDRNVDLLIREQHWINTSSPEYNICKIAGSNLGMKHSEDTKARISAAKRGRKMPPFTAQARANMSAAKIGIKRSAECIAKTAKARTGMKHSEETRAKMSAAHVGHTGKKHSEESRKKMSLAGKARIISVEQRQKMVSARIGLVQSPETIAKRVATFARKRAEWESLCRC